MAQPNTSGGPLDMQRSLGRRFVPLAAFIAAQLLIIALAPSRPPGEGEFAGGGSGGGDGFESDGGFTDGGFSDGTTTGGSTGTGGSGTTGRSTGGSGGSGGGSTGGTLDGAPPGSTAHCKGGRQFDPAIDFYAPPCIPRSDGSNPGATYRGVTGDKITVVQYYGKGSDAVDAVLRASGGYTSIDQYRTFLPAAQKFINANYELYGRKVELKIFQGSCDTIPPDVPCLKNEMDQMIKELKPFAVYWNTSLCSACFTELSRQGVVNIGGWHFRDSYNTALRGLHWDVQMSGTELAVNAGRWWCANLKGKVAKYAGTANPAQNLSDNVRKLGVISTNDDENKKMITDVLQPELAKCGSGYGGSEGNVYFYEQDIRTADQQRRAAVLKMNPVGSGEDAATSVMCFCDLVAPVFLYSEEQNQNYYPENLIVGSGYMDADASSQAYMGELGCPNRTRPCNFADAFGLSQLNAQEPLFGDTGQRVWNAGGGKGNAPFNSVTATWDYLNMTMSMIQAAGPNLNPDTLREGAWKMGPRGDATHAMRHLTPGHHAWIRDMREVYWSTEKTSSYNNKKGTYVQWKPGRFGVDGWTPGEVVLPPKPR